MKQLIRLLRTCVQHGELHLDAQRTELLFKWLATCEAQQRLQDNHIAELQGLFNEILNASEPPSPAWPVPRPDRQP